MKRFIYMLAAFALMGAVSCQPDEEVAVHASFTTDKESYDVGDRWCSPTLRRPKTP